ncbi:MAG: FAD-dependent oxidoreductase, partial [Pseudolabrys sp.]
MSRGGTTSRKGGTLMPNSKPHVLVLGGNFAGLGCAQKIRDAAGNAVHITLVDCKPYLAYIPNIPQEVCANRDPMQTMRMDIVGPLDKDNIRFVEAEVKAIDLETQLVECVPTERDGAERHALRYDFLVIALGTPSTATRSQTPGTTTSCAVICTRTTRAARSRSAPHASIRATAPAACGFITITDTNSRSR